VAQSKVVALELQDYKVRVRVKVTILISAGALVIELVSGNRNFHSSLPGRERKFHRCTAIIEVTYTKGIRSDEEGSDQIQHAKFYITVKSIISVTMENH